MGSTDGTLSDSSIAVKDFCRGGNIYLKNKATQYIWNKKPFLFPLQNAVRHNWLKDDVSLKLDKEVRIRVFKSKEHYYFGAKESENYTISLK